MGPGSNAKDKGFVQTKALLKAINEKDQIRELAINPLLLTVIALVHKELVILPDHRAELYEKAVNVLLHTWDDNKGTIRTEKIAGKSLRGSEKRYILEHVALYMQETRIREIDLGKLKKIVELKLRDVYGDKQKKAYLEIGSQFIKLIEERAGLLLARGKGIYSFSHLTFQEYLAACAIAKRDDFIEYTLTRSKDAWWREVVLLEAGYLSSDGRASVSELIQKIADYRDDSNDFDNVILSLDCIKDVGVNQIEPHVFNDVQSKIQEGLNFNLRNLDKNELTSGINIRSLAYDSLQYGGIGYWFNSEPEWISIPASPIEKGAKNKTSKIKMAAYEISRVPITNSQYEIFVNETMRRAPNHWTDGRIPKGLENHPVVYVSWYDAKAFCLWLSNKIEKQISLPTNEEWEKASFWDTKIGKMRVYPWGDEYDMYFFNSRALGLGTTTRSGIFDEGASPCGVLDMYGNVWEWIRPAEEKYLFSPFSSMNEHPKGYLTKIRGGSFLENESASISKKSDPHSRNEQCGFRVVKHE